MKTLGFIILRHVNSKYVNQYWIKCYDNIRKYYPENKIVIKFSSLEEQLNSKTIIQNSLLDKVIVALNLEPTTPDWLKNIGGKPVKLGLDLSGGVHFLLEVDIESAQEGRLELLLDTYRKTFQEERINFSSSSIEELSLFFQFPNKENYKIKKVINDLFYPLEILVFLH